ncbi:MAG: HEAT repeat domain-containing protein [Candidatus Electrothrix communis]|nr:MAG: HEAT repeat domain-containing protein [Candidatus Electrothrix communis]
MSSSQTASRHQAGSGFQPYIGLRPFTEQEKDRFFGRSNETSILLDKIRANRLTLLLAASGVGKSSLLQAGIMPELRTDSNIELIYYNVWSASPQAFKQAVSEHYGESYKEVSLKSILRSCTLFSSGQLILLLDQFEELFNYHRFKPEFQPFIEELSAAVLDRSLPVSFVFSMREDFALELNSFKESLPGVFDNYFRLEKLTCEQAREAIEKPLEGTGYCFAPKTKDQEALLDQVLHDLAKREQERQFGVQELIKLKELPLLVEPPHLQIVCQELWERHLDEKAKQITHVAYEKAGKTAGILNSYFLGKIDLFSKKEQALASAAFDHLVGTRAVKIAHPLGRLAELARADVEELQPVLDRLQDDAILRRQKRGEEFWYELYHDIFSESIDSWNREFKAQQRLKRLACGSLAVLFAGGLLFAGNNWRANHYGRYLQLSPKESISDRIEAYQGIPNRWDIFHQRGFLYEASFVRQQIEADKKFYTSAIEEMGQSQANTVGMLPLSNRIPLYMENGLYEKGYDLVDAVLRDGKTENVGFLPEQLATLRTRKNSELLLHMAETQSYTKKKIIAAFAQLGDISKVRRIFADEDANVRREAAEVLFRFGDRSVVEALVALLADKEVRSVVVETLGMLGVESTVPDLLQLIEDKDWSVRTTIARALGRLGDRSVVPALVNLLTDEDDYVRNSAVLALERLGAKSAMPAIVKLLEDKKSFVRATTVGVLGRLGEKSIIPALINLLEDEDRNVYMSSARALYQLNDRSVAPVFVKRLLDKSMMVRQRALDVLDVLDNRSVVPDLVKLLDNEDTRTTAVLALGRLGDRSVVPALVSLLADKDKYVRETAASALGKLGDRSIAPDLTEFLIDENAGVRRTIVYALGQLGDRSVMPDLLELLTDEDAEVRRAIVYALGQLGDRSVVSTLVNLFTDEDKYVRLAAASALGKLGDRSVVPALTGFLTDEDADVRRAVASSLGELGDRSIFSALVNLLVDKNEYVRETAASALGKLGIKSAAPELTELLMDEDADVRQAAAYALGKLQATSVITEITKLLDDRSFDTQQTAAQALNCIGYASDQLQAWQEKSLKEMQEKVSSVKNNGRVDAAYILGDIFTEQSVKLIVNLFQDDDQKVVKAAVVSFGSIGEYRPDLVQDQMPSLLAMTDHADLKFRESIINTLGRLISFRGQEKAGKYPRMEKQIRTKLQTTLSDPGQKNILRLSVIDAFGKTDSENYAADLYVLLTKLDRENTKEYSIRYRCLMWLGRMAYAPAYDYIENELKELEREKVVWRKERDSDKQNTSSNELKQQDKTWKKEHWEYMLGNALARIKPETTGIDLLNHPLYQVRQAAIRALASRIAAGAADATLIGKIIQAHQNFDPDDLPSPFPYAAFRAIDLALWNLEYTGKKEDVSKLKDILKNLKPCQVPGQEGAIKERLEWTIDRLDENLAKNAKLAAAG